MTLRWSKADAKRAEKMGFALGRLNYTRRTHIDYIIVTMCRAFKSDREAAEWVIGCRSINDLPPLARSSYGEFITTCRKAILLCCRGKPK